MKLFLSVNSNYLKTHKSARPVVMNVPTYAQMISVDSGLREVQLNLE